MLMSYYLVYYLWFWTTAVMCILQVAAQYNTVGVWLLRHHGHIMFAVYGDLSTISFQNCGHLQPYLHSSLHLDFSSGVLLGSCWSAGVCSVKKWWHLYFRIRWSKLSGASLPHWKLWSNKILQQKSTFEDSSSAWICLDSLSILSHCTVPIHVELLSFLLLCKWFLEPFLLKVGISLVCIM